MHVLFICCTIFFTSLLAQHKKTISKKVYRCSSNQNQTDGSPTRDTSNEIIKWSDPRVKTVKGRAEILEEALEATVRLLKEPLFDLSVTKLLYLNNPWPEDPIRFTPPYLVSFLGNPSSEPRKSGVHIPSISIRYVHSQRDTANARNDLSHEREHLGWAVTTMTGLLTGFDLFPDDTFGDNRSGVFEFPTRESAEKFADVWEEKYCDPDDSFCGADLVYPYKKDHYYSNIEIYPVVFERNSYFMEGINRWSKDPVQAVTFILLHEFGHLEAFIAATATVEKFPITIGTEYACDLFASSILFQAPLESSPPPAPWQVTGDSNLVGRPKIKVIRIRKSNIE